MDSTLGADIAWSEKLLVLLTRISDAFRLFVSNRPVDDYLLFVFSAVLLFWFMSLIGGFPIGAKRRSLVSFADRRHFVGYHRYLQPGSIAPRSLQQCVHVFWIVVFWADQFFKQRVRWGELGVSVDSEAGYDHGRGMALFGLLLVAMAWSLPAMTGIFNSTTDPVLRFSDLRDRFANLTAGLDMSRVCRV